MKKVKIILSLALTTLLGSACNGQQAENLRMEKDIEVMESILNELFDGGDDGHFGNNKVSGNYLPGYGVIFRIPKKSGPLIFADGDFERINRGQLSVLTLGSDDKFQERTDSILTIQEENFKQQYQLFFTNYGDLLSELKPIEKIMIIHGESSANNQLLYPVVADGQRSFYNVHSNLDRQREKTTVQVTYEDIQAFSAGKLSEQQFHKKILVREASNQKPASKEFDILANIFNRLYKDNELWLHVGGKVNYELIEGLGVIYEMDANGWVLDGIKDNSFSISSNQNVVVQGRAQSPRTTDRKTREQLKEERSKKYNEYVQDLKTNIIKYGKTLKSLNSEEVLMLSVDLPNCYACENPGKINLIVKASVLKDFSQRKIGLQQALDKIELREIN